ncbi:hypothetical protein D3C85_1790950 [compost metagenome]
MKKRVVGFQDLSIVAPDGDADDIGLHKPPDPGLALGNVAIQARVLQRDRGL